MSFSDKEISNNEGDLIVLYEFRLGETYWRYCTGDQELPNIGLDEDGYPATWEPMAILDEGISQGGNDNSDLNVSLQSDAEVAQLLRGGRAPSGKIWLTIYQYHVGDPDDETPVQWVGSVLNAVLADRATVTLSCRSIAGTYDRNGLRLFWGRMCPHMLYGVGCNNQGSNDKEDHAYAKVVATVAADRFTVTSYADPAEGSFSGGFMEWDRGDGSFERLGLESVDGNDFRVLGNTSGLEVGQAITVYPGCDRTTTVCKLFDNLPNYGGFPHMPGKTPFDGTPVF